MRVVAYLRVSTEEQGDSQAGLVAQELLIRAESERRGWEDVEYRREVASAKDRRRPVLAAVLGSLRSGDILVVSHMDRLSRSLLDFATILEDAGKQGWSLLVLDCPVDLSTATGEAMASLVAVFAQLERRLISARTKRALAVKRADGVRIGRPPALDPCVRERIYTEHESGATAYAIAKRLNTEHVPTAHGGKRWYEATVRRILSAKDKDLRGPLTRGR